jgi:undecaprenyl-diphosphatase
MYLGVHFPGDIFVGLLWGGAVGTLVWYLHYRVSLRWTSNRTYVSEQYTTTGYETIDIDVVISVFLFTLIYAILAACYFLYV